MEILATVIVIVGCLVCTVASIWLLVAAFRVSIGWGLLLFFLGWTWIPLIIFAVKYWDVAKRPLILYGAGLIVVLGAAGISVFALGLELDGLIDETGGLVAVSDSEIESTEEVLPPPRPTAQPTHPSWEAIVREVDRDKGDSWETFVPSPTPITGRPGRGWMTWDEIPAHIGKAVVIELENGPTMTAALEAVEPDRLRVRHVIGGGEASYWIEREQIAGIRPASG